MKLTGVVVDAALSVTHVYNPRGLSAVRAVFHFESEHTSDLLHVLIAFLHTHTFIIYEDSVCVFPLTCIRTRTSSSFLAIS